MLWLLIKMVHSYKYTHFYHSSRSGGNGIHDNSYDRFPYNDSESGSFEIHALDREIELQELKNMIPNPEREEVKDEEPPSDIELKFTNLSQESNVPEYKRKLINSKIFKFTSKLDMPVNIILVSTTRSYHPQLIFSEQNDGGFTQLNNGKVDMKFNCSKGKSYVIEVGFDKNVDTKPFGDISSGGFIVVISSTSLSIKEAMLQDSMKVGIWGYDGVVPFEQDSRLNLYHPTQPLVNHGFLNYRITPLYDETRQSIKIHYHRGTDVFSRDKMRSTTLELVCSENAPANQTFIGKEPSIGIYEYTAKSSKICKIIDEIK